jgi:hypothetical protein
MKPRAGVRRPMRTAAPTPRATFLRCVVAAVITVIGCDSTLTGYAFDTHAVYAAPVTGFCMVRGPNGEAGTSFPPS